MPKRVSLKGKGADLFFGGLTSTDQDETQTHPPAEDPAQAAGPEPNDPTVLQGEAPPARSSKNRRTPTSPQVVKYTTPQTDTRTSGSVGESTPPHVVKYTTHLRPETIKALKRVAFESERKDYEIVQEALDAYLKRQGRG